jgi:folylpolyglutamate synthase/dihydrofolate synthase
MRARRVAGLEGRYYLLNQGVAIMITVSNQTGLSKKKGVSRKNRSYSEVVEFLDSLKTYEYGEASIERMKALDKLFNYPSEKTEAIVVGGTNGKSSTINFASKLLREEGFKVGVAFSSHILTYNERLMFDSQLVSNKAFTDVMNEVINVALLNDIQVTTFEVITMGSLLYFSAEKVDVVLLEVGGGGRFDATALCNPKVVAVTRVTHDVAHDDQTNNLDDTAFEMMGVARKDTWFISAEQSKLRLQKMKVWAEERGIHWAMPIRKLASLPYIFEQLYGRSASLGERIAQLFVEQVQGRFSPFLRGNLLSMQQGQRGRPTLEAKKFAELNPVKTLKVFWSEEFSLLRGRFEILDKEKPSILLDNAGNVDAFSNLFLGVRLLHYQRPLKGLALIIGLSKNVDYREVLKAVRYLLKKIAGIVYFVPLKDGEGYDLQDVMGSVKELNLKAKACSSFAQAFELAKSSVDERHGLICITGNVSVLQEYWHHRGVKRI